MFKKILMESYKNLIQSPEEKSKYVDQVWDILQNAYSDIGGVKGNGFNSKQDMIDNIPFWKLIIKDEKVVGVILYKDRGGRKTVALGIDPSSAYAKSEIKKVIGQEIFRSYSELSKGPLNVLMKQYPWDILKLYTFTPDEASKALKKEVYPVPEDVLKNNTSLRKYPQLKDYGYMRNIGGTKEFKVLFGRTGLKIN